MKRCNVNGCVKPPRTRGWCAGHYHKWLRYGTTDGARGYLRADRSPTRDDLQWAAGFLEGEAHFGTNGEARCPVLAVAQVDREPLDRLRTFFGGSVRFQPSRQPNARDSWKWSASGSRALGIMMTLYPMLTSRRQATVGATMGE
jgi:hypothetical protein